MNRIPKYRPYWKKISSGWTVFFMKNRLRRWEAALMVAVACTLLMGVCLDREQNELAGSVIRLHVIANSDTQEDQALKLLVRDRVLEQAQALYSPEDGVDQALEKLEHSLYLLAQAGREVVEEQGYDYPVSASLEQTWFPTKSYQDFSLPAGSYTALRIVIGEGDGQNWWCVVFPPLCLGSVSQTVDEAYEAGSFTEDQVALITGESGGYVIKFKAMELWEQLKQWLS